MIFFGFFNLNRRKGSRRTQEAKGSPCLLGENAQKAASLRKKNYVIVVQV
ncbi:hypothetical protein Hanom_Chr10g00952941 [Helianthus anomalus]